MQYSPKKNEFLGVLFVSENDSYDIKIGLDPYPFLFPTVWEVGERIPKKMDRHIYSDTGSCCFTTKAKAQILLQTEVTSLLRFIDLIVVPYFQNNSYYELNGQYKTSEHSHNSLGVIEAYRDILNTKNDFAIAKLIYGRLKGEKLRIHQPCYCGSGLSLKKCSGGQHDKNYRQFRKIDKSILNEDLGVHFTPHLKNIQSRRDFASQ